MCIVGFGLLLLPIVTSLWSRGSVVRASPTPANTILVAVVSIPPQAISFLIPMSAPIAVAVAVAVAVPVSSLSVPRVWRPRAPSVSSLLRSRSRPVAGFTGLVIPVPPRPIVPHIREVIVIFSATGLVITVFGIVATHIRQFGVCSLRWIECWDGVVEKAAGVQSWPGWRPGVGLG